MRTIIGISLSLMLVSLPALVSAHIYLTADGNVQPRNSGGVSCGSPGTYHAIFESNSTVDIAYRVGISHSPFDIYLIDNMDENIVYTLAENIPDPRGEGVQSITFSDIECASCTLKIEQNPYYSSCADITLTASEHIALTDSVSQIQSNVSEDAITLMWENPNHINQVMILQSDSYIESMIDPSVQYQMGDMINGATVVFMQMDNTYTAQTLASDTVVYFQIFTRNMANKYSQVNTYMARTSLPENKQPTITLDDVRLNNSGVCEQALNIEATITDEDQGDMHTIMWTSEPNLQNQSTDPLAFYNSTDINDGTDKQYTITATVSDNGLPVKTHTQTVDFICMAETGDTTPNPIEVDNHAPTVVLTSEVSADTNCEANVEVFATIEDEDVADTFSVDWEVVPHLANESTDPLVFVNRNDTTEAQSKEYEFTVTVTDSGTPAQSTTQVFDYSCETHIQQETTATDTQTQTDETTEPEEKETASDTSLGGVPLMHLWALLLCVMVFSTRRKA